MAEDISEMAHPDTAALSAFAGSFTLRSARNLYFAKLSAVAAALERVTSLQQDYRQRIAETEAPADKERIVAVANVELTKAVTEQGLSVKEYTSISNVARDDAFANWTHHFSRVPAPTDRDHEICRSTSLLSR